MSLFSFLFFLTKSGSNENGGRRKQRENLILPTYHQRSGSSSLHFSPQNTSIVITPLHPQKNFNLLPLTCPPEARCISFSFNYFFSAEVLWREHLKDLSVPEEHIPKRMKNLSPPVLYQELFELTKHGIPFPPPSKRHPRKANKLFEFCEFFF